MKTRAQQIRETILKDNKGMQPDIVKNMVKGMAKNFHSLKTSDCEVCTAGSMLLIPVVMNVCRNCATRIGKRSGTLNIVKIDVKMEGYNCDWCGARTHRVTVINPEICEKCMVRFGRARKKEKDWKH